MQIVFCEPFIQKYKKNTVFIVFETSDIIENTNVIFNIVEGT